MRWLFLNAMLFVFAVALLPMAIRVVYVAFKRRGKMSEEDEIASQFLSRMPDKKWVWIALITAVSGCGIIAYGLGGPVDSQGTVIVRTYPIIVTVGAILTVLSLVFALVCLRWEEQAYNRYLARRQRRDEHRVDFQSESQLEQE